MLLSSLPVPPRGSFQLALVLAICAASSSAAQGIGSQPRAITLIAVKRPAFEALDAVRVTTSPRRWADAAGAYELTASVEIRDEGRCEIRVSRNVTSDIAVSVITETGGASDLREGSPVLVYRGDCHESTAARELTIHFGGIPATGSATGEDVLSLQIMCNRDGVRRQWSVDVPLTRPVVGH